MPRFEIVITCDDDGSEAKRVERDLSLDEMECRTQRLDLEEEVYLELGKLASISCIKAIEPVSDTVAQGDVVWRQWDDCDTDTADGRKKAIALLDSFKPLWRDRGYGYEELIELLCPMDWEVEVYQMQADQGYIIPKKVETDS